MNDILKENIEEKQSDLIDDDPFADYDLPFDFEFNEDVEKLNKIFNIENPFDYIDMEEYMDNLDKNTNDVDS